MNCWPTRIIRLWLLALCLMLAAGPMRSAYAEPLVSDLSERIIGITAGFSGADLLLFGSVDGDGDLVVVVEGPAERPVVRRKEPVAGVWINGAEVVFEDTPSFFAVAASKDLFDIATKRVLEDHGLLIEHIDFPTEDRRPEALIDQFREGLIRGKQEAGLFPRSVASVSVFRQRLYRTNITLPANVATGNYTVRVLLFRNGGLVAEERLPLAVNKSGLEARIYNFANQQAALYGLFAVVIALLAGLAAEVVGRRFF